MEVMDDSGADGLGYNEILEIPRVTITLEKLNQRSLQCSVCLEDLQVNDVAKKLPCEHYFHEMCIVPWLELRSTCPDCRRNLLPQSTEYDNENDGTYVFHDEDTLSGYESSHSNAIRSQVSAVDQNFRNNVWQVVESANGHLYYDDIEVDEFSRDDFSYDDYTLTISNDLSVTTRSPATSAITISDVEDDRYSISPKRRWGDSSSPEASGSRLTDTMADDTIDSNSDFLTVAYASEDDSQLEIESSPAEMEFSLSEISTDSMETESERIETISISSDSSMYDD